MDIVEATIKDGLTALESGAVTAVDLAALALDRVAYYDRQNTALNSICVLNKTIFEDAAASDARRKAGKIGALEGLPYTTKDSYSVKGMSVASGSPAFVDLIASQDAFVIQEIRKAGGVLIGLTNMPPMAAGGMQRGVYGRAESPYSANWLAAAFASGSSNGSGVATAASMGFWGLGEETVSSGRSPASNNACVAYTPSRGMVSIRANWPLFPTCDVVVPHCRTVDDLLALLDVICREDEDVRGDFWREQTHVKLPKPQDIRPASMFSLADPNSLKGKRLAVPKMYINKDPDADIEVRPSIMKLWEKAAADLKALGAELVETDLPVITQYEKGTKTTNTAFAGLSADWDVLEIERFIGMGWHRFLQLNGQPGLDRLKDVDPKKIFPPPPGALPDKAGGTSWDYAGMVPTSEEAFESIQGFADGLKRLETFRKKHFEDWLDENGFDGCVFPANADVGRADSDVNPESAKHAWKNGVYFSNGNRVFRHLGMPTTNVPMGIMEDIGMPVNMTFLGRAYSDPQLLSWAWAFESAGKKRQAPKRTPALPPRIWQDVPSTASTKSEDPIDLQLDMIPQFQGNPLLSITLSCPSAKRFSVTCNGLPVEFKQNAAGKWQAEAPTAFPENAARKPCEIAEPEWSPAMLVAVVEHASGVKTGKVLHLSELVE